MNEYNAHSPIYYLHEVTVYDKIIMIIKQKNISILYNYITFTNHLHNC